MAILISVLTLARDTWNVELGDAPVRAEPDVKPSPQLPSGSMPAATASGISGNAGSAERRHGNITLHAEPNGHAIDLDSTADNWGLGPAVSEDFSFEHYRVGARNPAQISEVDAGAGLDTCRRDTGYRSFVELRGRGLRDGDRLTFCVHTDEGRYAVLQVTVHGNGTLFSSVDADIRVWEPAER